MLGFSRFATILIGGILISTITHAATGGSDLQIANLRCENKTSPLGIDVPQPLLSWQLQSAQQGTMQSAYQILVASTPQLLSQNRADIWDSGKIQSDQSINVPYAGPPLTSSQTCFWKVEVWDSTGREAWSSPDEWEMGLLNPSDWKSSWIDFPQAQEKSPAHVPNHWSDIHKERHNFKANRPGQFRKTFTVNKPILRARLYASALGLYDSWINGQKVGDALFAPDWTDYLHRVRYQTYDVTALLSSGDNVISALLGDGWYSGNIGWIGNQSYGPRPALRMQLMIDYADGSHDLIATDKTWRTATGPILKSDLQDGEDYDATQEPPQDSPAWNATGFDDSSWQPASLRDAHPQMEAQIAPPVKKLLEIYPVQISQPKPAHWVFDFGQNMVGVARLAASAPRGTKITLRFAEMLNPDGTVYTENLRSAAATDTYIFKGEGDESWQPKFTFHGFRYAELTGYPSTPSPAMLTGIVIGSANPQAGSWECSNPLLNRLYSNIVWGQRGNFLSIPTDCPQRDERFGWMGDAQVFIRTAAWNCDVREFFNNWLIEVADAQAENGAYTDISPRPRKQAGEGTAAWADAGIICPWTIYQVYADTRIIQRQYPSMVRYLDYLQAHSTNFIRPDKGYGDWLNTNEETPKDLLATAYFAHSADLLSRMARAIGNNADADKYHQLFQNIRAAFNQKFVSPDGKIKGNTQTAYVVPLEFGLLDPPMQQCAIQYLLENIAAKHDHITTGFVGVSFILPILTQFGATDTAYRLILQDTFPSWLFPIKQGATTIWERWDGWTPDKGFQTPEMNSFNHYSLGSCGQWMYETIAGINLDPASPGFKHIIIRPQPGGGLTSASASYDSPYGPIKSRWQISADHFMLQVTIPCNTTATVYVPGFAGAAPQVHEIGSGDYYF